MEHEQVKKELEKKFTHVTFVRDEDRGRYTARTVWLVGEDKREIKISLYWKVEEILFKFEIQELEKIANTNSAKFITFVRLMKEGVIELDHTLYKQTTLNKLLAMEKE